MATKKTSRSASSRDKDVVLYRGIEIAPAQGKRSATAKIIAAELRKRAQARGKRKSA